MLLFLKESQEQLSCTNKLPVQIRKEIDNTNNVIAECNLFDQKAIVTKSRNNKFKAKGIRNVVVLHQNSFSMSPDHIIEKVGTTMNILENGLNSRKDENRGED